MYAKNLLSTLLAAFISINAFATTRDCSTADGTLRYKYSEVDQGIAPDPRNPPLETSSWISNGVILPGDAFQFDDSQDYTISISHSDYSSDKNFVTHVVIAANTRVPMICAEQIDFVP